MADTNARVILSAVDRTAQAFNSVKASLTGLEKQASAISSAFGVLIPAASVAGITAYFKTVNDGVDALNDLRDATGSSIENISALERVADRTGASLDTVGSALVKFNQLLNEATPGSAAEKSLRALGLEAAELRKLDPSEALRQYAVALTGFADDGNKARIVQEQLGKSFRELAPFLNDLAESGSLVARVTTEQAAEADKFNKQLFQLQTNAKDAARTLTFDLVQGINKLAASVRENGLSGLFGALRDDDYLNNVEVVRQTDKLLELENAITGAKSRGVLEGSKYLQNLRQQLEQTKQALETARNYRKVLDGAAAPGGERDSVAFDPDAERRADEQRRKDEAAAKKRAEELKAALRDISNGINATQLESIDAFVQADFEATRRAAEEQIRALEQASRTELQQYFDFIDQQQEDAIAQGQEIIRQSQEDAKQVANTARELGFTFSSAFEDAVIGGESLRNVLQGIGDDIARIILRRQVTEPLANAISGIDFGAAFANGGIMTPSGPLPLRSYATGGIASSPQLALFGEGATNEAFVPLPDGRRIPVDLNGGGAGANVVVNVIEAPGRGGEQASRQEGDTRFIDIFVEQVEGRMASRVQRGDGPLPAAMERTYGLNRAPGSY